MNICCAVNNIETQNVILIGDFHFKNITWEIGECTSGREQKLLDTPQDNLLAQMADSPTRGSNLVSVGDPSAVTTCEAGEVFGNIDHKIVRHSISCHKTFLVLYPFSQTVETLIENGGILLLTKTRAKC